MENAGSAHPGIAVVLWDLFSGFWTFGVAFVACLGFMAWVWLFRREVSYSFRKGWESMGENTAFFGINLLASPISLLLAPAIVAGVDQIGLPRVDPAFWTYVPAAFAIVLGLFISDFINYWFHRGMHEVNWLWPIHAIHHSDEDVNGLTTYRVHFIEPVTMYLPFITIQAILGLSPETIAISTAIIGLHNVYVHVDLDWTHGPLRYLIASPRYHRWHHADVAEAHGKNLANFFPFLDVWFGTYYVPGKCNERMGADGVPKSLFAQLAYPFVQWWQMARQWRAKA